LVFVGHEYLAVAASVYRFQRVEATKMLTPT
jgi:hypothetical protein